MTAYVTIPNSDVDPESPITTSLVVALRDNPTAITEGSTGAPRIQNEAIRDTEVGDYVVASSDSTATTKSVTYVKVKEVKIPFSGSLRVTYTLSTTNPATGCTGRIYINGVGILTSDSTITSLAVSKDVTGLSPGDLVQLYILLYGSTSYDAEASLFRIKELSPLDYVVIL